MQNAYHKIVYASSSYASPQIFLPPEEEAQIPTLINYTVYPPEFWMFHHGGEDVVAGRPKYIGVPKGDMPPLPIPIILHLTDN